MCSAGCAAFMGLDWRRIFKEHIFDTLYTCRLNPSKFRSYVFFKSTQWIQVPALAVAVGYDKWFPTMASVPSKHLDGDTSVEHHRLHAIRCCCAGADCCLMAITWGAMIRALAAWPLQFKPIWRMKKTTANGMNNGTKGIHPLA